MRRQTLKLITPPPNHINPTGLRNLLQPYVNKTLFGTPGWETLGSRPGSVAAGRDQEVRGATHNWPSVVRVWPVGISLSHCALATPVAGQAQCTLTKVARCTVFPPTHWCGWLPGWIRTVLRSSAAWLGCVSEGALLSAFVSPEPVREL